MYIFRLNSAQRGYCTLLRSHFLSKSTNLTMERKSLFGAQSRCWTPLENEFLAENEMIEIIPNFKSPKRHFIQVSSSAFNATTTTTTKHTQTQIRILRVHMDHFNQIV